MGSDCMIAGDGCGYREEEGRVLLPVRGWLAAGLTYDQFKNDSRRGYLKIWRRGVRGETLIDVASVRRGDRRAAIAGVFGAPPGVCWGGAGCVRCEVERDAGALSFFREYVYGEGVHLPEERIEEYVNNASILGCLLVRLDRMRSRGRVSMGEFYADAVAFAREHGGKGFPNTLPGNARSMERRLKRFRREGYVSLVSASYGNTGAQRLCAEAREWLVARWATPVERVTLSQLYVLYNAEAGVREGWKKVRSSGTIYRYLNRPEVRPLWYGMRYGELKSKELYTRHHKTVLPGRRDALWYGDGTKLNYYYMDGAGKVRTCWVYEVVDVYSEVLLGYSIGDSEDFGLQHGAYRMALETAGRMPYEICFDNQGGHKKLSACGFFGRMARLAVATQPYNGKSKTIEGIFGRFQSGYLHRDWFFTGQNVTSKKAESHANMEFILANRKNLPSLEEVKRVYAERRREWNAAPHPSTGVPREEMYACSENGGARPVGRAELLEVFGVVDRESNRYTAGGIRKVVKGVPYRWEVLTADGQPDLEFLRKNVGRSFYVEYDPLDMGTVGLLVKDSEGRLRRAAYAQKYIEVHRAKQEQGPGEAAFIKGMELRNKAARMEMWEASESLLEKWGMHPSQHGLDTPEVKGCVRKRRKPVKACAGPDEASDIGTWLKAESGLSAEVDAGSIYERY